MSLSAALYRPRNPQSSDYYCSVEYYFRPSSGSMMSISHGSTASGGHISSGCPKCKGAMRVIGSIEDPSVIRAILKHLGLWLVRARPPPKIHDPPICMHGTGRSAAPSVSDDVSQIPAHDDNFYGDPQYSWDDYIEA